jgi:hypothetical protein
MTTRSLARVLSVAYLAAIVCGCPNEEAPPPEEPDIEIPGDSTSERGACCLADGTCNDDGSRAACEDAGGHWFGFGSTCAGVPVCNSAGPFRDLCVDAQLAPGLGPWRLSTGENRTGEESAIPRQGGCRRIWLDAFACWTAPRSGNIVVDTCSEANHVDTVIAVYLGCECPLTLERLLACNDQADGCDEGASRVTLAVIAGQQYMIHAGESYDAPARGLVEVNIRYECDGPDGDADGVQDGCDNCAAVANSDQGDADGDFTGDACDNCPGAANANQADGDSDGVGDACDNCVNAPNAGQSDVDEDGVGDACEGDRDSDGVVDAADNCADIANADQTNSDTDAPGDACDNCPGLANADQADGDGDGDGDACDNCPGRANADQADTDADTVGDVCDNCPSLVNTDQLDADGDGVGNACDNCANDPNANQSDGDGDGRGDTCDNCPNLANADQADADGDGRGDLCDNCPAVANPTQTDADNDGIGDACEGLGTITLMVHVRVGPKGSVPGANVLVSQRPELTSLCSGLTDGNGNFACGQPLAVGLPIRVYASWEPGEAFYEGSVDTTVTDDGSGMMTVEVVISS